MVATMVATIVEKINPLTNHNGSHDVATIVIWQNY